MGMRRQQRDWLTRIARSFNRAGIAQSCSARFLRQAYDEPKCPFPGGTEMDESELVVETLEGGR
ncbi:MAG: hypothetical protein JWP89_3178, partial [Schlesneria sp.]|nr:hypothetical protein [Schlesneria sp.]